MIIHGQSHIAGGICGVLEGKVFMINLSPGAR